jgi:S1-C subfamily serine protease
MLQSKPIRTLALVVIGLLSGGVAPAAAAMPPAVYARTIRSAALILRDGKNTGSGSLVDWENRLVVTNFHVAHGQQFLHVVFPGYEDGQLITRQSYYLTNWRSLAYRGKVVHRDQQRDLAFIQLEERPAGVPALRLAADSPRAGEQLYRLGTASADGPSWKVIAGRVRWVAYRELRIDYSYGVRSVKARFIKTDCGGRYGDSGSAVVNARGELVGVHFSGTGSDSNATEIKEIKAMLAETIESMQSAEASEEMPDSVYERALRSAALILVDGKNRGSGVLVDTQHRRVITAYHVVKQDERVDVVFPAYEAGKLITHRSYYFRNRQALAYRGKVVQRDPERNLVVIELEELPAHAVALPLAAHSLHEGDRLYRLGTPSAKGPAWKCIPGKVRWAGVHEVRLSGGNQTIRGRMIGTDCGGRYGDGGCPVVNARGELIGVHFAGTGSTSTAIAVEEIEGLLGEDLLGEEL